MVEAKQGSYLWGNWELPAEGQGAVVFQAHGMNDVHVAIAGSSSDQATMYEVVIGGWGNTQSVIRRSRQGSNMAVTRNSDAMLEPGWGSYWVKIDNGRVSYGKGAVPGQNEKLSWSDPHRHSGLKWIGLSSWNTPVSYRDIQILLPVESKYGSYLWGDWQLPAPGQGAVVFQAHGSNDVHVSFADSERDGATMYEVVIGGWSNTQSVIRRSRQGSNMAVTRNSDAMLDHGWGTYWVKIDNGSVSYGKGSAPGENEKLSWRDPSPHLGLSRIGFSSWNAPVLYSILSETSNISQFAAFGENLLVNPYAETGNMNGWTLTQNGGEGWLARRDINDPSHNGFLTSYDWAKREQLIDLSAHNFTAEIMDAQPPIMIGEMFQQRGCADSYFLEVELLDGNRNIVHRWSSGERGHQTSRCDYLDYREHVQQKITHYGGGVRYIRWRDGGKGSESVGGHQGPILSKAYLSVLPPNLLLQPDLKAAWTIPQNGGNGVTVEGQWNAREFKTSYEWFKRTQTIDLLARGYSQVELDQAQTILVSGSYGKIACPDHYYLKAELLDANKNVITSWHSGIRQHQGGCDWSYTPYREELAHAFQNYGAGVRYIRWEDGGKDSEWWWGHYGTELQDPYIGLLNHGFYSPRRFSFISAAIFTGGVLGTVAFCGVTAGIGCFAAVGAATLTTELVHQNLVLGHEASEIHNNNAQTQQPSGSPNQPRTTSSSLDHPVCPDANINFAIASPKDPYNLEPLFSNPTTGIESVAAKAVSRGFTVHKMYGSGAYATGSSTNPTLQNYLNVLSCPNLKAFFVVGHGNGAGTRCIGGTLNSDVLNRASFRLDGKLVYMYTCNSFFTVTQDSSGKLNATTQAHPLRAAFEAKGVKSYIGSFRTLSGQADWNITKTFWSKVFAQGNSQKGISDAFDFARNRWGAPGAVFPWKGGSSSLNTLTDRSSYPFRMTGSSNDTVDP